MVANVWVNHNTQPGNAIVDDRSDHWRRLSGDAGWHWERFGGVDVAFTPAAFLQANYGAFDELVTLGLGSATWANPDECHVADVYAGTGALGLSLLARGLCSRLTAIEVTPGVAEAFDAAVTRLPAHLHSRAAMHVGDAGGADALAILAASHADVVVVDPPRKGLDAPLLTALCDTERLATVRRLLYVSCGFKGLMRDAVALRQHGWRLEREPVCWQLFPGTDALETVAHFVR
jgi:tRNA/tmRNA/rRNA uracil-C5-methylase (TrmA/RlmC/RlmD family)